MVEHNDVRYTAASAWTDALPADSVVAAVEEFLLVISVPSPASSLHSHSERIHYSHGSSMLSDFDTRTWTLWN